MVYGHLLDRSLTWGFIDVVLEEEAKLKVNDVLHEIGDELDYRDRVVNMSLGFNYLVISTTAQCFAYNVVNWDSPAIIDIKDIVTLIVQGSKYFCLVDRTNGLTIYNYTGSIVASPKFAGLRVEFLNKRLVSLSPDVVAIVDTSNTKIVRVFDMSSGKPAATTIEHTLEIVELSLNQSDNAAERKLTFLDVNRDLFISPVHKPDIVKIASMVDTFLWNERNDILACVADGRIVTWLYPNGVYIDRELMDQAKVVKEARDLGKFPQMVSFTGSLIQIRRFDGALVTHTTLPHASKAFATR